jgi:MATE efflux family protein
MQPFYAVLGILVVSRNSLQGLGSKLLPLISSIIELLGKMLFTWIIIPLAGTWGIIMCEPLIWVVMTIQLVWVYEKHPIIKEARKEIKSKRTDAELIERER